MKYKRLAAEMFVKGITKDDLAKLLGKSRRAINNRLNGKTEFSYYEAIKIMDNYFKYCSTDYIFSIDEYEQGVSI